MTIARGGLLGLIVGVVAGVGISMAFQLETVVMLVLTFHMTILAGLLGLWTATVLLSDENDEADEPAISRYFSVDEEDATSTTPTAG